MTPSFPRPVHFRKKRFDTEGVALGVRKTAGLAIAGPVQAGFLSKAWGLCDRTDLPWDNADRGPSHVKRRKALRQLMMQNELSTLEAA